MEKIRFTKTAIAALKMPGAKPAFVSDTETRGLCVRLQKTSKTFYYYRRVGRKVVQRKIGKVGDIALEAARRKVDEFNALAVMEGEVAFQKQEPGPDDTNPTIEEAMEETLRRSRRGEHAKQDWCAAQVKFLSWVAESHPNLTKWADLRRSVVRDYITSLDGLSANSKRLYTQPIVQTSRFYATEYNDLFRDVARDLRMGNKLKAPPPNVVLSDVIPFIQFCATDAPIVLPVVVLCGLAALRPSEAVRLTWDRVDLDSGIIEISGETKNEYSQRVIPICDYLVTMLQSVRKRQASCLVKAAGSVPDHVCKSPEGMSYDGVNYDNLTAKIREVKRRFNPDCKWTTKDLRNALPSWAASAGRCGPVLEQYLGHNPGDITQRHYTAKLTGGLLPGDRAELERQMDTIRNILIDPWQAAIEAVQKEAVQAENATR